MFLLATSLMFLIPVICKKNKIIKRISCALSVASFLHHRSLIHGFYNPWLALIDKTCIYSLIGYTLKSTDRYTRVPWFICTSNCFLLYFIGLEQFTYEDIIKYESEWYHGTFMHMCLHWNGLLGILCV